MQAGPNKAVRIVAIATIIFGLALMVVAVFDHASMARFMSTTRAFVMAAALAHTAAGVMTWRLAQASSASDMLTRYRDALLTVLAAYAVSFLPLGVTVLSLGVATVALETRRVHAVVRVLRAFVVASTILAVMALASALRAEDVFRRRLEGLVQLTSVVMFTWHALAAILAGTQLPALQHFVRQPETSSWNRFLVTYRRGWLVAAVAATAMLLAFLLVLAFVYLERSSGPPR